MPQLPAGLDGLFRSHVAELAGRYTSLLRTLRIDSIAIVTARTSPEPDAAFRHWLDLPRPLDAALEVRGPGSVVLYVDQPGANGLHAWQTDAFEVRPLSVFRPRAAPPSLRERLSVLHLRRTPYEIACLRLAAAKARAGHDAARETFFGGGSAQEVLAAFLESSGQSVEELPYPPIVAFGRDAATVHPADLSKSDAQRRHSAVIDLGARFGGYVADVTRSYATSSLGREVAERAHGLQRGLIASVRPGQAFGELHALAHLRVAEMLRDLDLIRCSPADALSTSLTEAFFPHGTGHYIGVDVHAAGGTFADDGSPIEKPAALGRTSIRRALAQQESFTIEPGIYFDAAEVAAHPTAVRAVNWDRLAQVASAVGGVRFEDVVLVEGDAAVALS